MIRIEKIHIQEFRGIRDLTLQFKGLNFAVCGPNGTGKSGIVDAIEFALTGTVSRLSGTGTGGLSVKIHGPHVDSKSNPERAMVTLNGTIPSLGKKFAIQRCVKTATKPHITPLDTEVSSLLKLISKHPEFVLSRREIIQYIITQPTDRAAQVQSLLRLSEIDKLKKVLLKISNAEKAKHETLKAAEFADRDNFVSALGISAVSEENIRAAVNPKRMILGLAPIGKLEADTSLKEGLTDAGGAPSSAQITKTQAISDIANARQKYGNLGASKDFVKRCNAAIAIIDEIGTDTAGIEGVTRQELLNSALTLYDGKHCPVCDTPLTPEVFERHVRTKLARYDFITKRRASLDKELQEIRTAIMAAGLALRGVADFAAQIKPKPDMADFIAFKGTLLAQYTQIDVVLPLGDTKSVLEALIANPDLSPALAKIEAIVAALPERSQQDEARDFLTIAQERLEKFRQAKKNTVAADKRSQRASVIYATYGDVTTVELEKIYKNVETKFAEYYRIINKEDEGDFSAQLIPSAGKLDLGVDFYNRGFFPPHAYHSEGHQDGMGLCLYLALMDHILGKGFTFAVLDDVVMSVDAGHRREVCRLLMEKFPHTQFVFTTHDDIWLKHMASAGLIIGRNFARFRNWSVDMGPTDWESLDIWAELGNCLSKNDVRSAAALLRHYLEYFAKEACGGLRAKVEFKGDAQFSLSDVLPSAIQRLGELLKNARLAAQSWDQQGTVDAITALEARFSASKQAIQYDQWQINFAVHFNDWDNLQRTDFDPVVAAFKEFTENFACGTCRSALHAIPSFGSVESVKCGCGIVNLNLNKKPGQKK